MWLNRLSRLSIPYPKRSLSFVQDINNLKVRELKLKSFVLSSDKIVRMLMAVWEGPPQRSDKLRKYATHLFSTPLWNVSSDNKMSILILILTKHVFDI